MTYYLNKIVYGVLNPMGIALLLLIVGLLLILLRGNASPARGRVGRILIVFSAVWLWVWSCGVTGFVIGSAIERDFPPKPAEEMPVADAIVVLGGGMSKETNSCVYAEIQPAADRSWHGARLYKAGKAKKVFVTFECDADLMVDLGVPREAIMRPSEVRNTEEEARFVAGEMKRESPGERPKVLLVTSAWHMRRAMLMFEKYAKNIEVIPAPTDHESLTMFGDGLQFADFVPDPVMLGFNSYRYKEILGYWGYRLFRH